MVALWRDGEVLVVSHKQSWLRTSHDAPWAVLSGEADRPIPHTGSVPGRETPPEGEIGGGLSVVQAKWDPSQPDSDFEQGTRRVPSSVDEEFEVFFNSWYGQLLSFASIWGRNHHDADDALGIVMADMYRRWDQILDPVAYARRAVTWTILKIRRDRHDDRYRVALSETLPDALVEAAEFERLEGEEWVNDLLTELPPTQYAVLSRFLDGCSMKEIADELRKSESTIRQNLKLARDRLRPFVKEYDRRRSCPSDVQETTEES